MGTTMWARIQGTTFWAVLHSSLRNTLGLQELEHPARCPPPSPTPRRAPDQKSAALD